MKQNSKLLEDLSTIGTIGDRARTLEQARSMKETVGQGMCPFCKPQTENWKNPLIKRFGNWILKKNDFPYKNHDHHFVIIFESHTNDIEDVKERDWVNLGELLNWTVCKFDIQGGGFAMRFGHSDFNASTIRHLHAHIQVPSKDTIQQLDLLRRFHEQCNCPICKLKDNKTKLLLVNDRWRAANVCTPLPFHKKHIVIANKETFDDITKLDGVNWVHLGTILQATTKNMKGGGIIIRFGDSRFHGGFPGHVYCEVMEPDLSGPSRAIFLTNSKTGKPICKATFCKDRSPEEEARRKKRIAEII